MFLERVVYIFFAVSRNTYKIALPVRREILEHRGPEVARKTSTLHRKGYRNVMLREVAQSVRRSRWSDALRPGGVPDSVGFSYGRE